MMLGLLNFVLRRQLIVDATLPEGQQEAAPRGLGFVALLVALLLAVAWMVVSARAWYVQLFLGAGAAAGIMALVQVLINRGLVTVRSAAGPKDQPEVAEVHPPLTAEDRNRLFVVFMMLCFSATFWFVFQQAGSSLNLFARELTNRHLGGFEIPASWFQTINAVGIVALGPAFVWLWTRRGGRWPSSPVKFALGLLFAALGFLLLVPASLIVQRVPGHVTQVGMGWLLGVYSLHTVGELCLSPVGLSYVSRLAPKQLTSQLMGAWFFSIGIGSYLAGKAAGFMDAVPLWQIYAFGAAVALGMSLLLWLVVSRIIHRLMGGYS